MLAVISTYSSPTYVNLVVPRIQRYLGHVTSRYRSVDGFEGHFRVPSCRGMIGAAYPALTNGFPLFVHKHIAPSSKTGKVNYSRKELIGQDYCDSSSS
jgi:hypothetical protein